MMWNSSIKPAFSRLCTNFEGRYDDVALEFFFQFLYALLYLVVNHLDGVRVVTPLYLFKFTLSCDNVFFHLVHGISPVTFLNWPDNGEAFVRMMTQ